MRKGSRNACSAKFFRMIVQTIARRTESLARLAVPGDDAPPPSGAPAFEILRDASRHVARVLDRPRPNY
jgi:hypothetical protein